MSEDPQPLLAGLRAGAVLAGYRLEAQAGAGGMAVVFRARDERLDRLVALKLLAPALASDAEFRVRFIAESRAAAAVDDPFIIPVYEAGEAGGMLFIAMRFVRGGDLGGVLEAEGALPPERAAAFISPVASALDAAHRAGLVHRDVKPGNILIDAGEDRPDHVYLSDFGVAKAVSEGSMTGAAGYFVGTPDYAAPEQIQGRAVDGRADQYALACVAFQLLTGAAPFRAGGGIPVLLAHVTSPPPSLTARRPDLPAAAGRVLARALAKDPADRYPSCLEFAAAFRDALGLPPFDPDGGATVPGVPRSAAPGPATMTVVPARAAAAGGHGGTDPGAGRAGAAPARPVTTWLRRRRRPALVLASVALALAGAAGYAVASAAVSRAPAQRPAPAAQRPAARKSLAAVSSTPGRAPRFTRVPLNVPASYTKGGIGVLAFNPAGTVLAIAAGNRVCLWDIAAARGCATSSDPAVSVAEAAAFSPDGKTVAVAGPGSVLLLNARTMKQAARLTVASGAGVRSLAFSSDGKTTAVGDSDGHVYLWDVATGKAVTLTDPKSQGVSAVAFSPHGGTLAASDVNGSVYLWRVASRRIAFALADPVSGSVNSVAFSPDGKTLAAGDFNGHVYLWDTAAGKLSAAVITDPGSRGVNAVAFSPDGKTVAVADSNTYGYLWDIGTGKLDATLSSPKSIGVAAVVFSPKGGVVATGDQSGEIDLWRIT